MIYQYLFWTITSVNVLVFLLASLRYYRNRDVDDFDDDSEG